MWRLTTTEVFLLQLQQLAMAGNVQAASYVDRLKRRTSLDGGKLGVLIAPEAPTAEEWIRRAEVLNQFAKPPESG